MDYPLQKPEVENHDSVMGCVMVYREWPPDLLRAAKIGAVVLVVSALLWLGGHYEQIMHKKNITESIPTYKEVGEASWYGPGFQGQETANGEIFDTNKMTAAHPSLPLGTKVEVTNLEKDKTVEVRINDRGPYAKGRVIDLSRAAANKLGMVGKGTAKVKIVAKTKKKKVSKRHSLKRKMDP